MQTQTWTWHARKYHQHKHFHMARASEEHCQEPSDDLYDRNGRQIMLLPLLLFLPLRVAMAREDAGWSAVYHFCGFKIVFRIAVPFLCRCLPMSSRLVSPVLTMVRLSSLTIATTATTAIDFRYVRAMLACFNSDHPACLLLPPCASSLLFLFPCLCWFKTSWSTSIFRASLHCSPWNRCGPVRGEGKRSQLTFSRSFALICGHERTWDSCADGSGMGVSTLMLKSRPSWIRLPKRCASSILPKQTPWCCVLRCAGSPSRWTIF
mmetsp:Transcript_4333/g.11344  ORF Transcript_4333/g.11344 Transcript_4333/m.11344 type:complete len:264 (-) Transcript_4333:841-1632(-)